MNNQIAASRDEIVARLDAIPDPLNGEGLMAAGRIQGLSIDDAGKVSFTLEAPRDAIAAFQPIRDAAEIAVRAAPGVSSVLAVLTAHEAGSPAAAGAIEKGLKSVKAIIAVSSAKGGVGKSTAAVNLACAFKSLGLSVGLLDLDVYGPSLPTLLGVADTKPQPGPEKSLIPVEAHGLKTMSIGFLVNPASPMVWRGAMATSAARQMMDDVLWGALDILVLDLPPGTGDVQLTLVQHVALAGAIIVSTPQEMALADVRRGIAMFEKTHAPILGIIENMAYFEETSGARAYIFGEGGARRTAKETGVPFLGELPINVDLRKSADAGAPLTAAHPDHAISKLFVEIAKAALANAVSASKPAPAIRFI
jgi:ATP-binding protein involved in chromosome partitioning